MAGVEAEWTIVGLSVFLEIDAVELENVKVDVQSHGRINALHRGSTTVESKTKFTINGVSEATAQAVLDGQGIKLKAGSTQIIISKDGGVVITKDLG